MIKCVRVLCVKFGHACAHGMWLCAPLASLPPGHHMQSLEPRPAPSVGLMPSLSPEQLSPTSLIILAGTMQNLTTATRTPSGRTKTFAVRDRHNWWSQGLSHNDKVARACLGRCFWNSFWLSEQVSDEHCRQEFIILNGQACNWTSYPLVEWSGEEHILHTQE